MIEGCARQVSACTRGKRKIQGDRTTRSRKKKRYWAFTNHPTNVRGAYVMSAIHERHSWTLVHHLHHLQPSQGRLWCGDLRELRAKMRIQGKEEEQGEYWQAEERLQFGLRFL